MLNRRALLTSAVGFVSASLISTKDTQAGGKTLRRCYRWAGDKWEQCRMADFKPHMIVAVEDDNSKTGWLLDGMLRVMESPVLLPAPDFASCTLESIGVEFPGIQGA
jgi:hypothetical protein